VNCHACAADDDEYVWTNETWRVRSVGQPTGLPLDDILPPAPDEIWRANVAAAVSALEHEGSTIGS
jgi:hypothetical protein